MPYYQKPRSTYGGYKKPVKSFQDLEVYQKSLEISVFVAKNILPKIKNFSPSDEGEWPSSAKGVDMQEGTGEEGTGAEDGAATQSSGQCRQRVSKYLLIYALNLPHLIAEAHSVRFGDKEESIVLLEKVMLSCNKIVVYLEQVRDICKTGIEWATFDDLIKKIFDVRRKVLHLQMSWKKYMELDKGKM